MIDQGKGRRVTAQSGITELRSMCAFFRDVGNGE